MGRGWIWKITTKNCTLQQSKRLMYSKEEEIFTLHSIWEGIGSAWKRHFDAAADGNTTTKPSNEKWMSVFDRKGKQIWLSNFWITPPLSDRQTLKLRGERRGDDRSELTLYFFFWKTDAPSFGNFEKKKVSRSPSQKQEDDGLKVGPISYEHLSPPSLSPQSFGENLVWQIFP